MALIELKALYDKVHEKVQHRVSHGTLAGLTEGNFIGGYGPDGYLWDTPHGNWTGPPSVKPGHSDALVTKIGSIIRLATGLVDIVTMKFPTGKFWEEIKDSLLQIAKDQKHVHLRLLIGFPVDWYPPNLWHKLEEIAAKLKDHPGYVSVDLGIYRYFTRQTYPEGWNHAKILAVDGKVLLTGGHNLWDEDYLGLTPVFDLSMQIDGPIARGGHAFANSLWQFISKHNRGTSTYSHRMRPDLTIGDDPPDTVALPPLPPNRGSLRAMWVTNSGRGVFMDKDGEIRLSTMLIAFREAIATASRCRISQQSFGSFEVSWSGDSFVEHKYEYLPFKTVHYFNKEAQTWHAFNLDIVDDLVGLLVRRRDSKDFVLEILMTPPERGSYSNGEGGAAILDILAWRLRQNEHFRGLTLKQLVEAVNRLVKLCWPAIKGSQDPVRRWDHTGSPMFNHSKLWMLDDRLLYVGSENMYPSVATRSVVTAQGGLQEFGVIVEADDKTRDLFIHQYHGLAMTYGARRLLSEADVTFPIAV